MHFTNQGARDISYFIKNPNIHAQGHDHRVLTGSKKDPRKQNPLGPGVLPNISH